MTAETSFFSVSGGATFCTDWRWTPAGGTIDTYRKRTLMPSESPVGPEQDLQFDQADYSSALEGQTPTCNACSEALSGIYFEAGGKVFCPSCKERLERELAAGPSMGGMIRAGLFGVAAMLVAGGAYYGIRTIANIELAIATIAMGWLVGTAVRRATRGQGGVPYQILAVLLTYASVALSYLPNAVFDISEMLEIPVSAAMIAEWLPQLIGFVFALPVRMGMESPLLILIYGFGLFQAWQTSRKPDVTIAGPFELQSRRAPVSSAAS